MARLILAAAVLGLATAPVLNASLDPLEVFRPPAVSHTPYGADRVAKLAHLFAAERYDALLLGSSRTALLDPSWRSDTAGRWYNLGLLGAAPTESAAIAAELAMRGRLAPQLALGLDVFGFAPGGGVAATATHPSLSGRSRFGWALDQLFAPSAGALADVAVRSLMGVDRVRTDTARGGALALLGAPAPQRAAAAGHAAGALAVDPAQLQALRRLIATAEVAGATVCLFWHPHSPAVLERYDRDGVARLKRAVLGLGAPVIDLMEAPWTRSPAAWFDAKHLSTPASRRVLDAVVEGCAIAPTATAAMTVDLTAIPEGASR